MTTDVTNEQSEKSNDKTMTMTMMVEGDLYDFCLDWQMMYVGKEVLKEEFQEMMRSYGLNFESFKKLAIERNYFVPSMNVLKDVL